MQSFCLPRWYISRCPEESEKEKKDDVGCPLGGAEPQTNNNPSVPVSGTSVRHMRCGATEVVGSGHMLLLLLRELRLRVRRRVA